MAVAVVASRPGGERVGQITEAVGPEYRLLVLFLAYTGLRWGEMAACVCTESTSYAVACSSRSR